MSSGVCGKVYVTEVAGNKFYAVPVDADGFRCLNMLLHRVESTENAKTRYARNERPARVGLPTSRWTEVVVHVEEFNDRLKYVVIVPNVMHDVDARMRGCVDVWMRGCADVMCVA